MTLFLWMMDFKFCICIGHDLIINEIEAEVWRKPALTIVLPLFRRG
ncbi:hypothetical protein ABFZ85_06655 [Hyphococcus formosus]